MLSVGRGQVVRVIQPTVGEWWYVEDRFGQRGYVPHTYLKVYPTSAGAAVGPASDGGTSEKDKKVNKRKEEEDEIVVADEDVQPPENSN